MNDYEIYPGLASPSTGNVSNCDVTPLSSYISYYSITENVGAIQHTGAFATTFSLVLKHYTTSLFIVCSETLTC